MSKKTTSWKHRIKQAFEHLEKNGTTDRESFDLKSSAIDWLTSNSTSLKLACKAAGYEFDAIREQAIRVIASQSGSGRKYSDSIN